MIFEPAVKGQTFFAPEVVQSSEMDCGPASLKCLLEGFGISVNYGRLREACQTDVDGTSIDTLEDLAIQLGLRAEQVMLPVDHLILPESQALPAILVIRLPNGLTHFLVIWGTIGSRIQVMDPASGRRWPSWNRFINEIYIHTFPVSAQAWREWAASSGMQQPLSSRLLDLMISEEESQQLLQHALEDPGWRRIATLDAATRLVTSLVNSGGIERGEEAANLLSRFYFRNLEIEQPVLDRSQLDLSEQVSSTSKLHIPASYWSVFPADTTADGEEQLLLRGAVLVRILGKQSTTTETAPSSEFIKPAEALSPDLQAALTEPAFRPEWEIWRNLKQDGLLTPAMLGVALLFATIGITLEALLFQGLLLIGQSFTTVAQRVSAAAVLLAFVLFPLILEYPITSTVLRMGRRLETRLRISLLEKIPRLGDRYFHSRLTSDMAQRAYDLRQLRFMPSLGVSLLRTAFQLVLTTIGVIWIDPISAPLAIGGTLFFFALSFLTRPILDEQDLRLRTQIGALSRFYLDALLGLVPAKTHSAERALRRQHEFQLSDWVRSGRDYFNLSTYIRAIGTLLYSSFAILIVMNYISKGGEPNEILLMFYWTLSLPALGQTLAGLIQQYPMQRNRLTRLLEPLSAPDEEEAWQSQVDEERILLEPQEAAPQALKIEMKNINLVLGGHRILENINLTINPGEHIAVVGPSGAGKSSLVGLLLGWHRPISGQVLVNGLVLDGNLVQHLRQHTAWVDPAVRLWNRSLFENLRYGMQHANGAPIGEVIDEAGLFEVVERLPDGMKTILGEGGGLVSGGEGQRVRLGRAFFRSDTWLAILDEPFRGLDRSKRRSLLQQARQHWQGKTLICITHDVGETLEFDSALVIEDGQIIEAGDPRKLRENSTSRYYNLLRAEEKVRKDLWSGPDWQRFTMDGGHLKSG
jgi:ABC-type bacteriocin/lantibiotic exporter with double-glycine peptidase domain